MIIERLRGLAFKADLARATPLIHSQATRSLLETVKHHHIEAAGGNGAPIANSINRDVDGFLQDIDNLIVSGCSLEAELLLIAGTILSPPSENAIARLAELYESSLAYADTVSFTKEILESIGPNAEAGYQLSFALYMLGRPDEALEYILPYYIYNPSQRVNRLCGLLLKKLGRLSDAIEIFESVVESNPSELHSIRALAEIYSELGIYQKCLDILHKVPEDLADDTIEMHKAIIYRYMGELDLSIERFAKIISRENCRADARWPQCFNFSIAGSKYAQELSRTSQQYWSASGFNEPNPSEPTPGKQFADNSPIRIGFLTGDLGEHVVSRFLAPLLRLHEKERFFVALLSTARRFEQKSMDIASMADCAVSLQELSVSDARSQIKDLNLDLILDTNGFTMNSGLHLLGHRCAPIQCHYIGYHATTGLKTIDYFLGDSLTTPSEFQWQYTENLVQIPRLWMAYDPKIEFPEALAKAKRDSPVFGAFSQVAKINSLTLQYWGAAMMAVPDSILVVKDRGVQCPTTRKRIEETLEQLGIHPDRIYFFGPVGSHLDHLDSYNAIDIALDTTPWSGATTAFEALGMGVPLVAICGDTTSGRMSTSVVSAAGKSHWIAHSKEDFARIAAELAEDYQHLRKSKASMQREIRSGILFDEQRICHDFYATIERIVANPALDNKEKSEAP